VKAQELSRKYATAVFSQALDKWVTALGAVADRLADNVDLIARLDDTSASFKDRQKELDKLIPSDADRSIRNFLYTILKEGDMGLLADVIGELERMTRGGPTVQVARITTALPLSDQDKDAFRKKLRQKYGEDLEFIFNVDSSIIGGAIIQIGDKIIDGSVATKLESMGTLLGVKSG